jgi:cell wall-associated NlpC family hydrolase
MGRWAAPPGSLIKLKDMGPWTGRWLVNDVTRGLFDSKGTITLKKPLPALPEPDTTNVSSATGSQNGRWAMGGKGTGGGPVGDAIVAVAKKAAAVPGASTSYEFGGPPGIGPGTHTDCSGFVLAVYAKVGITKTPGGKPFPRTSQAQWAEAPMHPTPGNLEPGDLVFFNYEGPRSHVGIFISGKDEHHAIMIADQHTGSGIVEVPVDWSAYDGAARYTRKNG